MKRSDVFEAAALVVCVSIGLGELMSHSGETGGSAARRPVVPVMLIPPEHGGGVCWQEVRAFLRRLPVRRASMLSWRAWAFPALVPAVPCWGEPPEDHRPALPPLSAPALPERLWFQ